MARTKITPVKIPSTGLSLADLEFDPLPPTTGNGVEFVWKENLWILLYDPDDPDPTGNIIYFNDAAVLAQGGSVAPALVTVNLGDIHIIKAIELLKQADGMVYLDSFFATFVKILDLN